jgi:D-alanyl-D-alanine-carboxypeptidase/D-alanyl-D-alanine-endopeptidase
MAISLISKTRQFVNALSWASFIRCAALVLTAQFLNASPSSFSEADSDGIKTFLRDNFPPTNLPTCMVIGWVDSQGSRVFAAGKLGNGTEQEANGDTVFFIGSVSKTFTTLLLQDMVERGEMKLEDPVARFLPKSVKMPTHNGREITLIDLATHTAGFPVNPDNMSGGSEKDQYETYTVERMYDYLSSYRLPRDPGAEFQYSNLGMALLGHAIALKAGTNFESLIVNRISRPLRMESTCITLTPELKRRLAIGRDASGNPSPPWKFQAYSPVGDIHSTANDLLKYAAAQAGLAPSRLAELMEKTHQIRFKDSHGLPDVPGFGSFGRTAMDWVDREAYQPPGMELLGHAGGAGSYHAWVGFDKMQRRGVVVLSTTDAFSVEATGWTVLQRLPLTRDSARLIARETVGLGFAFDVDKRSQTLRVTKVFAKSPAAEAGLTPGLVIARIEDTPTTGKTVAECVTLLRASGSQKVRLELINLTRNQTNRVELTRGKFLTSG